MPVPLLDLSRQHAPLEQRFAAAFDAVLKSGVFVLGPEVEQFEREVAHYCGVKHAIGLSSGTDALLVAMMALGIGPGDEVLCPAFSFFATASCVVRLGGTPVWVDVRPDTFNIDLEDAVRKINSSTRALVPVHLFGQACDMECIQAIADKYGLFIVEDAAQALGAKYQGQRVGSFGHFAAFSFYPTKNLGGFGDGGMLVTQSDELADMARWLRNHGMHPRYYHKYVGGNFRLDAIQAALMRIKLPFLESYHENRAANAAFYLEALNGVDGLILPVVRQECRSVWNQFTVRVTGGRRDALRKYLADKGIGSEIYYPVTLDQQECFREFGRGQDCLLNSHQLADDVLSIPVFPELRHEELQEVAAAIVDFFNS